MAGLEEICKIFLVASMQKMKIALVCTSLGHTWRGFERFTSDLFTLVERDLPITLFGTGLNGAPNRVSLPCLKYDAHLKFLKGKSKDNYYFHQLSYAFSFIPLAVLKGYDLIHYSEPSMGNFLYHARKMFKFRYKLLFTDGLGLDAEIGDSFERPDHIQILTLPHYEKVKSAGVAPKKITCLPYGVDSKPYLVQRDKKILRRKYGIPEEKVVILSVSALNRRHKRIDYLIHEASQLGKDYFLLIAGQQEERDLITLGERALGGRFRSLYLPPEQLPEVYGLADIFVMASLAEGFCLALVEAMCAGLPGIAHESDHFRWLTGDSPCLIDMTIPGNLAKKILEIRENNETFKQVAAHNRDRAVERFDWDNLKSRYLDMYERAL